MAPGRFERFSSPLPSDGGQITDLPSSPPAPPSRGTKLKKPPPVTPRRFQKFFTPRSSSGRSNSTGRSGRQLQDITRSALNRTAGSRNQSIRKSDLFAEENIPSSEYAHTPRTSSSRKRKAVNFLDNIESSPIQPSPIKRNKLHGSLLPEIRILVDNDNAASPSRQGVSLREDDEDDEEQEVMLPVRIKRLNSSGVQSRVLQRSLGGFNTLQRGRRYDHCSSWQDQTTNFYSGPEDACVLPVGTLPFCTASCNMNSLVAVGDEDGSIRFLETGQSQRNVFSKEHICFRPHNNAIMDLAFSSDDRLLATASGDQTAHVIDVSTQKSSYILSQHSSSLKQICFQPGHDSVLASSSRDGTVQLWDLRCKGAVVTVDRTSADDSIRLGVTVNTILASQTEWISPRETSKSEPLARRLDTSITALTFMPEGRENLLLTASDASSCIKLWDIRSRYSRRNPILPLSTTRTPESHSKHRHFGINSMVLSGNGARLYALSRDNTVYAYSTNHLILGSAPELSSTPLPRHRHSSNGREGLGPLYGFRHAKFHATTFYVKAALRKATPEHPELLAVGSSDGCPVVFPTDEAFLRRGNYHHDSQDDDHRPSRSSLRPLTPDTPLSSTRANSSVRWSSRMEDTIPIYTQGTALMRGHAREVTSVSWTHEGKLVSASDDFTVRRWQEGNEARYLRSGGESEGRRWGSGWADAEDKGEDETN